MINYYENCYPVCIDGGRMPDQFQIKNISFIQINNKRDNRCSTTIIIL